MPEFRDSHLEEVVFLCNELARETSGDTQLAREVLDEAFQRKDIAEESFEQLAHCVGGLTIPDTLDKLL